MKPEIQTILKLPALEAAPRLLGCVIRRKLTAGTLALKIVEVEAYHQDDPASHSFKWQSARTAPMFKAGGHLYVYFTYGMHYCLNIVVGPAGRGEAVLLRAGQPLEGVDIMRRNRGGIENIQNIANGPGKLTQALGIKDTRLSGKILNMSSIWVQPGEKISHGRIIISPRIGITDGADSPMRFYIKDNPFVSRYNRL